MVHRFGTDRVLHVARRGYGSAAKGPRKNGQGRNKMMERAEDTLIYIGCPCGCGKDLEIQLFPLEEDNEYIAEDIPEVGNNIWQQLVDDKGLEGAIEFLHNNA